MTAVLSAKLKHYKNSSLIQAVAKNIYELCHKSQFADSYFSIPNCCLVRHINFETMHSLHEYFYLQRLTRTICIRIVM